MSQVRSSGTKIETVLGKALWAAGLRYRKQYKKLTGKPDFVLVTAKIAIFCDSAFWHGRNWSQAKKEIKSNRGFWIRKIESNIRRDELVTAELRKRGWFVLRFWDEAILKAPDKCVGRVLKALAKRALGVFDDKGRSGRFLLRRWRHDPRFDRSGNPRAGRRR
jgi:DNA mismatch endonuclease (patch repair protein)